MLRATVVVQGARLMTVAGAGPLLPPLAATKMPAAAAYKNVVAQQPQGQFGNLQWIVPVAV
jgi:hypothetical protein